MTSDVIEESNLVKFAREEMLRAGLYDRDADYGGEIPEAVLEMVKAFSRYGHSGGSAEETLAILNRVIRFRPLSPLTNDPDEWIKITDGIASDDDPLWQSRRQSTCFSHDGGKTYYDIEEPKVDIDQPQYHTSKEHHSA